MTATEAALLHEKLMTATEAALVARGVNDTTVAP